MKFYNRGGINIGKVIMSNDFAGNIYGVEVTKC